MPTPQEWIGEYSGEVIIGLFDRSLTCPAGITLQHGDIVTVANPQTQRIIAPANSAFNRVIRLLATFDMNPCHPASVMREAQRFSLPDALADPALTDQLHLPYVTIDNEDSRDLDQALHIERSGTGYTVRYALADAAWFIRPGTELHHEAAARGVTYYAPNMAVTMLPPVLSEGLISLNPDVERRAFVFEMSLDIDGVLQATRIERAKIKSQAKLSYAGVQAFYDAQSQQADHDYTAKPWAESLNLLQTVGMLRLHDAAERNVIEFNRSECQIFIDAQNPDRFGVAVRRRYAVEQYNEQLSLLCNTAGAALLDKLGKTSTELQAIYRVHLPPLRIRMQRFQSKLDALIEKRKLGSQWQWNPDQALADYVRDLPQSTEFQRIRTVVERMIMLTNRASQYTAESDSHYALGVDAYARFSSPMREMVGIFTHKELLEALDLETDQPNRLDEPLRASIIEIANEAKKRQNKLEKECQLLAIDDFLRNDLDLPAAQRPQRKATVMGVRGKKLYILLDDFALDLKIYLQDLENQFQCHYETSEVAAITSSKQTLSFVVGDEISVITQDWHQQRRRFIFGVVAPSNS